jgi:hypothetical protein
VLALAEETPEVVEARLTGLAEDRHDLAHAFVLALDVPDARGMFLFELSAPIGVGGRRQPTRDPRFDDEQRELRRQRNVLVLERTRVEQERVTGARKQRCGLIHDPARYVDRAMLGTLERLREVERLDLELRDGAESGCDCDFECGRRSESGPDGQIRMDGSVDSHWRPAECGELVLDRCDVSPPAARAWPCDGPQRRPPGGDTFDADAEVDCHRQGKPTREVGELADQVDATGRPERPGF